MKERQITSEEFRSTVHGDLFKLANYIPNYCPLVSPELESKVCQAGIVEQLFLSAINYVGLTDIGLHSQ